MQPVPLSLPKIDLMVLYDKKAWNSDGYDYTEPVLLTKIVESIQETNQAMKNSEVDLKLALVHVGRVSAGVDQARSHGGIDILAQE